MPVYAITGTPGTGKTTLATELRARGYAVIDISRYLRDHGLLGNLDEKRNTYEVDTEVMNDSLEKYRHIDGIVFLDSHLAHQTDCSGIIVLRCNPSVLAKRLESRGYGKAKITENVQAEILDVILCEATDTDIPVWELDCTDILCNKAADIVENIINGKDDGYVPGGINWSEEFVKWF